MPLVLESEGPRLEGVEGEVSQLGGEEKPSWEKSSGQPAAPSGGWSAKERGDAGVITLGHWGRQEAPPWDVGWGRNR